MLCTNAESNDSTIELLLNKAKAATITPDEVKELRAKSYVIQNYGQNLDEGTHDYKGSLPFISKAIDIFTSLHDTLNVANNLKFRGYLFGRLGDFAKAKNDIHAAIDLFQSKNAAWGVAVSQFDLSRVYEFENKPDSAIYYCNTPLAYWNSVKNNLRILGLQTMLTNLFTKLKEFDKARMHQQEAEKLATDPEVHWLNLLDFYYVSEQLFKRSGQPAIAARYRDLYDSKRAELNKNGGAARSYYDNDSK
ncbi:hypothetical protein [Ferruginibacter sp.]